MSYNAGDYKWGENELGTPSGEIIWTSDLSSGLTFDDVDHDIEDFQAALQAAFDAWEDVSGVDFTYSSGSDGDVDVVMGALSGSTVGLASYSYYPQDGIDTIFDSTITMDSLEGWAPYGEDDLSFYAVALHEIGHILGLGHVNDTSEIMNPYISTNTLGDGDIFGVQYLYGSGDAPVAPPPPDLPDEPVEEPEDVVPLPPEEPDDGGGLGAGAGIAALLGLLVLLFTSVFGGAGAAVAMA